MNIDWRIPMAITDDQILSFHDANYLANHADFVKTAKSGNVSNYYNLSYIVHGLLSAAEATEDTARLDRSIELLSAAFPLTVPITSKKSRALRCWNPLVGGKPDQIPHFKIAAAFARAGAIIRKSPKFNGVYSALADRYSKLAREISVSYWIEDEYAGSIPWLTNANGGWGTYTLWQDRTSHLGAAASWLYPAAGETAVREIARKITTDFKGKWKDDGKGGVVWDLGVPLSVWKDQSFQNSHNAQDTSHANADPMMMVAGYESQIPGIIVGDLVKMGSHLINVMSTGTIGNPSVSNYIDGNNSPFINVSAPGGIGAIYPGWILLGRYHTGVQLLGEDILSCIIGGHPDVNPCVNYNSGVEGRIALSGHLYRNRKLSSIGGGISGSGNLTIDRVRMEYNGGGDLKNLLMTAAVTLQGGLAIFSLTAVDKPFRFVSGGNISAELLIPIIAGQTVVCIFNGKEVIPIG